MQKKHLFTLSIAFLSLAHLIFSYFYIRMYGYFNLHGHLNSFMTAAWILRFIIDVYIVICGFFAIREERYKVLPFYLLFFYSISYFHLFSYLNDNLDFQVNPWFFRVCYNKVKVLLLSMEVVR